MVDYRVGLKLFGVLLKDGTIIAGIETFRFQTKSLGMNFSRVALWCYFSQVLAGDKKLKFHKQFHIVWESGAASKNFSMNWSALTSFSSPWAFSTEKLNYAARPTTFVFWTWKMYRPNELGTQHYGRKPQPEQNVVDMLDDNYLEHKKLLHTFKMDMQVRQRR